LNKSADPTRTRIGEREGGETPLKEGKKRLAKKRIRKRNLELCGCAYMILMEIVWWGLILGEPVCHEVRVL